jgi:uncharacterized protein (TIGR03086 family)
MTSPTAADSLDQLTRAFDATERLVAGVRGDQWTEQTGCPGWSVRDLLGHVVAGQFAFAAILTRENPPDNTAEPLGADPTAAYRDSGEALRTAFSRPGVLDEVFTVPAGTVPGVVALHLRLTELLVHGWDLARATGQSTTGLPADLAEQERAFSRVQIEKLPPDRRPFAPPQPVADDAPAIDRLAALLGRPVTA